MEITILERDDDITHVVLTGRLDTTAAEELGQRLSEETVGRKQPAIIELSDIDFLASMGIGLLLATNKKLLKDGHKLIVLNPRDMVDAILKASKVDKILLIVHDLDEAVQLLQGDDQKDDGASPQLQASVDETGPQHAAPVATPAPETEKALKLKIANEISEFKTLNASLTQFLTAHSVPSRAAYAVDLAVEELVMNVIRYAFIDDDTHLIEVELAIEGDQIILRITDDGRPFDPREDPALDLQSDDREIGGLGLTLVLDMVDALKYQRVEDTNRIEVRVCMNVQDQSEETSEPVPDLSDTSGE